MSKRIRLGVGLALVVGVALVAFLFWRRSLIVAGTKLAREKDQIAFIRASEGSASGDVYVLGVTTAKP